VFDECGQISHYVVCFEDLSERKEAARLIKNLAYYDELTGLPNRRFLLEQLDKSFGQTLNQELIGALLFIDIDHFKTINDSLGHATGDWLLQQVAIRLGEQRRATDLLVRLGGDEFVMLIENPEKQEAEQIIQNVRDKLARHLKKD
jgi:diguanylate cyclase (GGDEF)-like protein